MKTGRLINTTQKRVIARRLMLCRSFFSRMKGLLGTSELAAHEACWIIPCNSIHTFGMRYTIDVCFLNKKNQVVFKIDAIGPNRLSPLIWKAHSVLEIKAGQGRDIAVGDCLSWEEPL